VVTAKPEPVTDAIEEEIPPDLGVPLSVSVDEAPPLATSGVVPNNVRQLSAADTPLKPAAAEPPGQHMLLMVAPSPPADPLTPPEPSTGMDDQKVSPVEELA
jgi:hypothetical protein